MLTIRVHLILSIFAIYDSFHSFLSILRLAPPILQFTQSANRMEGSGENTINATPVEQKEEVKQTVEAARISSLSTS